ncbi:hypothetical protein B296_00031379 [Ensete ventricosum]|uniref:Uncharacterized protein n=1 Tax=Ensete ventricosum TaxID=4639 RepID=A0A426XSR6_ENSVE|nr:hypothetical protein B296_00031379 [Ensete ventricosum]
MVINFHEVASRVEFRSVFRAPSHKFKILANPNVLAHGKSYENAFTKKCDSHKLCAKSCAESSFNRFFEHCLGNLKYWPLPTVKFGSVLRAPSQKFKILAIPDVLANESSFDRFYVHHLENSKYWPFSTYWPMSSFDRFFVHCLRNSKYWPFPTYHGKSYEHGFTKKRNCHKLCAKSRAKSSFDLFFVHYLGN